MFGGYWLDTPQFFNGLTGNNMADPTLTFVNRICNEALRLSGKIRDGSVPTSNEIATAIRYVNQNLAVWSTSGKYVFYTSRLTFPAITNTLDYRIGNNSAYEVNAKPFATITNCTYSVGDITYTPVYLTYKEFSQIAFKVINSYPGYWSYAQRIDYTLFQMFPRTTGAEIITIDGKQTLSDLTLFEDASSEVPEYAVGALQYAAAEDLAAYYDTSLAGSFGERKEFYMGALVDLNIQDNERNRDLPFITNKSGYTVRNGSYS